MVLVPPRLLWHYLFTEIGLWWWCLHLPGRPFPATNTNQETYSFLKLNKLVVSSRAHSRITTTKRALPVSESNGPFPCPSPDIELSWRLESNQTLCLARQYPHRCVPDSSRASHLFAALVGRTSCLKHLACTFPVVLRAHGSRELSGR